MQRANPSFHENAGHVFSITTGVLALPEKAFRPSLRCGLAMFQRRNYGYLNGPKGLSQRKNREFGGEKQVSGPYKPKVYGTPFGLHF